MTPKKLSRSQGGFTLLELLLVIGIAAVLFLGISKIASNWADTEVASGAGQQLQRISTITQNYVEANWSKIKTQPTADALNVGGDWADLRNALDQEGLLSNGELRSSLSSPMKIAFVTDVIAGNTVYRTTIYATDSLPYKRVIDAARHAGNTGGIISFFPDSTTAFGAFGQWKVPTIKMLPGGSAPCIPGQGTACLVAMISYNQQTLCGPFLYRDDVETTGLCAGGNTMTTDLQMDSHDILNAGNVQATNMVATDNATLGDTTIGGTATFNGATTASGGMKVNSNMTVSGDANFSNDVTIHGGSLNVATLNASTIEAPRVDANTMNAQTLNVNNGTLAVDNDISVNGSVSVNGPGAEIFASSVNAGEINAGGGDVVVGTMNVQNTMEINGQVNVTGNTIAVDRLVADKCVKIAKGDGTYDNYGTCL